MTLFLSTDRETPIWKSQWGPCHHKSLFFNSLGVTLLEDLLESAGVHKNILSKFIFKEIITLYNNVASIKSPYSSNLGSEITFKGATFDLKHNTLYEDTQLLVLLFH